MQFSISNYVSDGPGFKGAVDVSFSSLTRGLVIKAGETEITYVLPGALPRLVQIVENAPDVAQQAFLACSAGTDAYDAEEFQADRIVTLEFVGGLRGYFVLFGEPCYAVLTAGRTRYSLQEEVVSNF